MPGEFRLLRRRVLRWRPLYRCPELRMLQPVRLTHDAHGANVRLLRALAPSSRGGAGARRGEPATSGSGEGGAEEGEDAPTGPGCCGGSSRWTSSLAPG